MNRFSILMASGLLFWGISPERGHAEGVEPRGVKRIAKPSKQSPRERAKPSFNLRPVKDSCLRWSWKAMWAKRAGGGANDNGTSVAPLADGSVVVVGEITGITGQGVSFEVTATFDAGGPNEKAFTVPSGRSHASIAKYNENGDLVWVKRAGGDYGSVYATGVGTLADGSSLVTGFFNNVAVFGSGETHQTSLVSMGSWDVFIAKFNANGTLAWAKRAGGDSSDTGRSISVLSDGSFLIAGEFSGTSVFGQGESAQTTLQGGYANLFVARYNANGALVWAKYAKCNSVLDARSFSAFPDGSSIITGRYTNTMTFAPGETNETALAHPGNGAIFLARYNADGALVWARRATNDNISAMGWGVSALPDGVSYLVGEFTNSVVLGPGEPNQTALTAPYALFLAKYQADGALAWAKPIEGGVTGRCAVSASSNGEVLVTGAFSNSATFAPGAANQTVLVANPQGASHQLPDVFLAMYNASGTLVWAKQGGRSGSDSGLAVSPVLANTAFVTGSFSGTASFGTQQTEITAEGNYKDMFVVKYQKVCEQRSIIKDIIHLPR